MILLVPLSRFEVPYDVGKGRPYSKLEALILRAIAEGAGTLDGLRATFAVHPRLLIEALVTLTQAGWLAVSNEPGRSFVLTAEGRQALEAGGVPESLQTWSDETYVLMERLTGSVILNDHVRYVRDGDLDEVRSHCVRLRPQVPDEVDQSSVARLLPRAQGEYIRSIGQIELKGRDFQWLPVTVNLTEGTVSGVPDAWWHLRQILIDEARSHATTLPPGADAATWGEQLASRRVGERSRKPPPPDRWSVKLGPEDLLCTQADHERYLRQALERAHSTLVIASAFAGLARLEAIGGLVDDALRRGVNLDLLWGYEADEKAVNWFINKDHEAKRERWTGRLRTNRRRSESHAKLLFWDRADGQFEACLGSCNWLSFAQKTIDKDGGIEVSVRLTRPGLLAQLSRCIADLYKGNPYDMGGMRNRRQQEAAMLERLEATGSFDGEVNADVSLIRDREHEWSLREWLSSAQNRLLVTSDHLTAVAATRLVAAEGRVRGAAACSYAVWYGRTDLQHEQLISISADVQKGAGTLVQVPGLHAKVVVADETACVSSYNFLSADPYQKASGDRELGVVVKGAEPVTWLVERLWLKPDFEVPPERAGDSLANQELGQV